MPDNQEESLNQDDASIHVCVDKYPEQLDQNPDVIRPRPGNNVPLQLTLLKQYAWPNGSTVRVRFLDGDPEVQERVKRYANEWSQHAHIYFAFGDDDDAEIRISFRERGSWSYLGTYCKKIARNQPTMNYGWLRRDSSDAEVRRVVLHEFGHALGFIHEHQHPEADIPWDKQAVYNYYTNPPNSWTREQVDHNLFRRYAADTTQYSVFDTASIMLYPIPQEHTEGDYSVGMNDELSAVDKAFVGMIYPKPLVDKVSLVIDAEPIADGIQLAGTTREFSFEVARAGQYTIETSAIDPDAPFDAMNDTEMRLYDAGDNELAYNDDREEDFYSRIVEFLNPGEYTVKVNHLYDDSVCKFRIGVRGQQDAAALVEPDVDVTGAAEKYHDKMVKKGKRGRMRKRGWADITGITLHQFAIHQFSSKVWYKVRAHLGVHHDGTVYLINPFENVVQASNGFNSDTVAIEVAGNYRENEDKPSSYWKKGGGPSKLTDEKIAGLRKAIRYIIQQVELNGGKITSVYAHRQSSKWRRACPGELIWKAGGEWAQQEFGLTSGGPEYTRGSGTPIPAHWYENPPSDLMDPSGMPAEADDVDEDSFRDYGPDILFDFPDDPEEEEAPMGAPQSMERAPKQAAERTITLRVTRADGASLSADVPGLDDDTLIGLIERFVTG